MSAEDPKLKMMQKVLDGLAPVLHKDDCDLGELLTLASMAMETWLDTRYSNYKLFFIVSYELPVSTYFLDTFSFQFSYISIPSKYIVLNIHFLLTYPIFPPDLVQM